MDGSVGHVGIINQVRAVGGNWRVVLEGANQSIRQQYTKFNCTNVSLWRISDYPQNTTTVAYYVRGGQLGTRSEVIVDDRSGDFVRTRGATWYEYNAGYNGHIFWTWAGSSLDDSGE